MKSFFITALAALFLAVTVPAAPQQAWNPTIDEVIYEISRVYICAPKVVGQTIGEGDFKSEYIQFKQYFDTVLQKLSKCSKLEGLNQRYSCVSDSIEKFANIFAGLIDKVSVKSKAMVKRIQTDLKENCTKYSPLLKFECNTVALNEASTMNGLTNEYKKFQQQIESHLDAWKQCLYPFCEMKGASYVYSLSIQYIETVAKNPNFSKFFKDFENLTRAC